MNKPATPLPWIFVEGRPEWSGDPTYEIEAPDAATIACDRAYYPTGPLKQDAAYIVEACNAYPQLQAERDKLLEDKRRLVEALHHAVQDCSCTPNQRASGHHVDCRAPEWKELLAELGEIPERKGP